MDAGKCIEDIAEDNVRCRCKVNRHAWDDRVEIQRYKLQPNGFVVNSLFRTKPPPLNRTKARALIAFKYIP